MLILRMLCKRCDGEILLEWRLDSKSKKTPLLFCSRSCSNVRVHTVEQNARKSDKLKLLYKNGDLQLKPRPAKPKKTHKERVCSFCNLPFIAQRRDNGGWPTLCSSQCYRDMKRRNARGHKNIEYNGVKYDSLWEIEMVKFFEAWSIKFTIPEPISWIDSKQKQRFYYSDFYVPLLDLYIDPKNPIVILQQAEKLEAISKKVLLLYGSPSFLQAELISKLGL